MLPEAPTAIETVLSWMVLGGLLAAASLAAAAPSPPLTRTVWGQRWGYAQDAPLWPSNCSSWTPPCPRDAGPNVRLGCESTAIAQIMFYHRRCPTGAVNYAAPGFPNATMNFSAEAVTLCDWSSFALAPPNVSSDPAVQKVARFEFAAALVVEKVWGTSTYALSHADRARAVSAHFGANVTRLNLVPDSGSRKTSRAAMVGAIVDSLQRRLPMKMQIGDVTHQHYHHVVIDGFDLSGSSSSGNSGGSSGRGNGRGDSNGTTKGSGRSGGGKLMMHLNIGHSGCDNGWYDFDKPICLRYYQNGTTPAGGGCAYNYDDPLCRRLWLINPM